MRRQVEGKDINDHEEGAGDYQVHHIQDRPSLYHHLQDMHVYRFGTKQLQFKAIDVEGAVLLLRSCFP